MKSLLLVAATSTLIAFGWEKGAYADDASTPLAEMNVLKKCSNGAPVFKTDKIRNVRCAIRYHGFRSSKDYDPANPDKGLLKYQTNPRTPGDLGILATLEAVDTGDSFALGNLFYSEKGLGLEYTVTSDSGIAVTKSGCEASGDLELKVYDGVEKRLLAHASLSISSLVSTQLVGHGPNQITVGLPKRLIDAQLMSPGADERLLTQVKFQCDSN